MKTKLINLYKQSIAVWNETAIDKPDWAFDLYECGCPFCEEYNHPRKNDCLIEYEKCPLSYGLPHGCEKFGPYSEWRLARKVFLETDNELECKMISSLAQNFKRELEDDLNLLLSLGYVDEK